MEMTSMGIATMLPEAAKVTTDPISAFMSNMTLEITPRQADKLELIKQHVAPGLEGVRGAGRSHAP
jgi:hypothetical protein